MRPKLSIITVNFNNNSGHNLVTRNYVDEHVEIGIASLRMIIDEKKNIKHLKFDW